jgi:hypothetical protein
MTASIQEAINTQANMANISQTTGEVTSKIVNGIH